MRRKELGEELRRITVLTIGRASVAHTCQIGQDERLQIATFCCPAIARVAIFVVLDGDRSEEQLAAGIRRNAGHSRYSHSLWLNTYRSAVRLRGDHLTGSEARCTARSLEIHSQNPSP